MLNQYSLLQGGETMKRSKLEITSLVLIGIGAIGLVILLIIQIAIIGQKGAVGALLISDSFAGGLALWAAYSGTKQNPNIRAILIGAVIFFILGRIAQYKLIL
jgi:hypothetical protein